MCSSTAWPIGLGVEPEPVVAAQDAQVGAQLALVGEHGGVAALPGSSASTSFDTWPWRKSAASRAAHEELRAVGAVHQPDRLRDELVVAGGDHATSVLLGAANT